MTHSKDCPICREKTETERSAYLRSPEGRLDELEPLFKQALKRIEELENERAKRVNH